MKYKILSFYFAIVGLVNTQNVPPLLTLKRYSMFTRDTPTFVNSSYIRIPRYFKELEFECTSTYPTKWIFSANTYEDESLAEIPKVIKTKLPVNSNSTSKSGPFIFSSTVLLTFRNTEHIQNLTCRGLQKNSLLNSAVLNYQPKFNQIILHIVNGTVVEENKAMRFGKNILCNLSIYIDVSEEEKKFFCKRTVDDNRDIKSKIIGCNNPDECSSFYRGSEGKEQKECPNEVIVTNIRSKCSDNPEECVGFKPDHKAGVIVCHDGLSSLALKYQLDYIPTGKNNIQKLVLEVKKEFEKGSGFLQFETPAKKYYEDMDYSFTCRASMYAFAHGMQWVLFKDSQPNIIELRVVQGAKEIRNEMTQFYTSTVNVTFSRNDSVMQFLDCRAPVWNTFEGQQNAVHTVTVLASFKPKQTKIHHIEKNNTLICTASAQPPAQIQWDVTIIDRNTPLDVSAYNITNDTENMSQLVINTLTLPIEKVRFVCTASNFKGNDTIELYLKKDGELKGEGCGLLRCEVVIVIGIILSLFLILLGLLMIFKIKQQKLQQLTDADVAEFENGVQDESNNNPVFLPYNVKFEIPKEHLSMDGGILGSGYFGTVKKGMYDEKIVAIKTVKRSAEIMHFKALLSELKIMCHIGSHPHLVNLVGACTKNIRKQEVYIVVEFCSNGNLVKLLRNARDSFVDHYTTGMDRKSAVHYVNAEGKNLSTKDLVKWSSHIASGMQFLNSKHVIHGDLAARNVLVSEDMTAKLCDFGLSKQLFDYTVYVQKPQKPLPLKWMAIESLRDLEFSLESDIWSFGVTIWEVFSLGQSPYPGVQWDYTSWNLLEGGYRMSQPEYAKDTVYQLMKKCWEKNPKLRMPFGDLRTEFEKELHRVQKYSTIY